MRGSVWAAAATSVALAVGCSGGGSRATAPPPPATRRPPVSASPSQRPAAAVLPTIQLRADLEESPVSWNLVASVPFGARTSELGYEPSTESGTGEPRSFAIAPDGSIWILDAVKARVAHYATSGAFLGAVGGVGSDAQDVVFVGTAMIVLADQEGDTFQLGSAGGLAAGRIALQGRAPQLTELVATPRGLFAQVGDDVRINGIRTSGFDSVDLPGSGTVSPVAGLPLGPSTSIMPAGTDAGDLELAFIASQAEQVQPITVQVLRGTGSTSGLVGMGNFVVVGEDLAAYVTVSAQGHGPVTAAGRWVLQIGAGTSPLVWERVVGPGVEDDQQVRHLATGPDGGLYLLVLTRTGAQILERP